MKEQNKTDAQGSYQREELGSFTDAGKVGGGPLPQIGTDFPSIHPNKGGNIAIKCQDGQTIKILRFKDVQDRWRDSVASI